MALNNQAPNSTSAINGPAKTFEDFVDKFPKNTIAALKVPYGTKADSLLTQAAQMMEQVDIPIITPMTNQMIGVMKGWFNNPVVLCCLIKGLFNIYQNDWLTNKSRQVSNIGKDFTEFLDLLIAFIDLITALMINDFGKGLLLNVLDFVKDMTNAVHGALLLVLQSTFDAINDVLLSKLQKALSVDPSLKWWAKCLSLNRMIDILKSYINDHGILATLFSKLKSYVDGLFGDFSKWVSADFVVRVSDFEYLRWLRQLLVNLKTAVLDFDMCVEFDYIKSNPDEVEDPTELPKSVSRNETDPINPSSSPSEARNKQGVTVTDNGAILIDRNNIPVLSNNSIRSFMNKYYGIPLEVADQIITGSTAADSIIGSSINSDRTTLLNADCPSSASPEEIVAWAKNIKNKVS